MQSIWNGSPDGGAFPHSHRNDRAARLCDAETGACRKHRGVQNLHFSFFLAFPKRRGTRRCRVFIDYCGVFQGNPIGGKSQSFAYSQYLPFGFEWKEPLGRHGGALRVSAVSGAGRDLSKSIGNAFTVSQAWDGNTLYLYQAYLVQKAFDDQLEIGIGRVSATQFFATLPAFDLLLNGGLNSLPIAFKLNSTFTSSSSASWFAGKGGKNS